MNESAAYADADISVLTDMGQRRPWAFEMSGDLSTLRTTKDTDAILTRLLDYMPDVRSITIRTAGEDVHVRRAFPDHKGDAIDALLAGFFEAAPGAKGLTLHRGDHDHTTTPEAPFESDHRTAVARIRQALDAGKISHDEAIERLTSFNRG